MPRSSVETVLDEEDHAAVDPKTQDPVWVDRFLVPAMAIFASVGLLLLAFDPQFVQKLLNWH